MKYAAAPRQEIGIRTIFNLLGPLTNPASASIQLLGVYAPQLVETLAKVLNSLGSRRAIVVHGHDGLDELSTTGDNMIAELREGQIVTYTLNPEQLGLGITRLEELKGGTPKENAEITVELLQGKQEEKRDIVLLNASAALVAASKAPDFKTGIALAAESIDSGKALKKLQQLIDLSQKLGDR
jgi:anthranilate phosphoribosyltransferase